MIATNSHFWRTYRVFFRAGLLFSALVVFGVHAARAAPPATVSSCSFTPTQGGPGTVIHAQVDQWFSTSAVEVGLAVPITPSEQLVDTIEPLGSTLRALDRPLATMQPIQGHAETTFHIPARLSLGKPIPLHNLYLVCMENGQVSMGEGPGPWLFTFTPGTLPVAGQPYWIRWFPAACLALIGAALVIAGVSLRRGLLDSK